MTVGAHSNFQQWSPNDVAKFFSDQGYAEYANLFVEHHLTGERVVLLAPQDLKTMGIERIGDRLGIQRELRELKVSARTLARKQVVSEHQEAFRGTLAEQWFRDNCCACLCPREPDKYTLMTSVLKIRKYHIERFCGLKFGGCLGGTWANDTIQLNRIVDVDTVVQTSGVSLAKSDKIFIMISASAGNDATSDMSRLVQYELYMEKDDGLKFAKEIQHQIHEYKLSLGGRSDAV
mmetsp:Transcript_14780/g.29141  ORF Transcript_14780/g.29141 Transcript_14780/m.29141 type:complete len:234 (-) Transcript_14780:102-803(-)|eukprot:CAMPEP_0172719810 /NCGR_PEP_ID=MMETSP1074-20121228/75722_1 /TAXON_ID=2916 /ORGANISM="Ceratium fusus, Strain PA161109" /LENGTH=233 /DNA_ID=CAMNT_0013545207 /DNA_START=89 /DNA_END=790 /DNA_ORIENTATION=+